MELTFQHGEINKLKEVIIPDRERSQTGEWWLQMTEEIRLDRGDWNDSSTNNRIQKRRDKNGLF